MRLFIQALSHLDVSLWQPQAGLTGNTWWVDLLLEAPQGEDGMLLDFGRAKPWAKALLDAEADHRLLLPAASDLIRITSLNRGSRLAVSGNTPYPWSLEGPRQAFALLPVQTLEAAQLAAWLTQALNAQLPLPEGRALLQLRSEDTGEAAVFHYSHGLRLHEGNCQRIAHGHRSKLEVFCDGQPHLACAHRLAAAWDHAYFYDAADLLAETTDQVTLGYEAAQGFFQLTLPKRVTRRFDLPTTVENLAFFLWAQLNQQAPEHQWQVRLCEGIHKGALAD